MHRCRSKERLAHGQHGLKPNCQLATANSDTHRYGAAQAHPSMPTSCSWTDVGGSHRSGVDRVFGGCVRFAHQGTACCKRTLPPSFLLFAMDLPQSADITLSFIGGSCCVPCLHRNVNALRRMSVHCHCDTDSCRCTFFFFFVFWFVGRRRWCHHILPNPFGGNILHHRPDRPHSASSRWHRAHARGTCEAEGRVSWWRPATSCAPTSTRGRSVSLGGSD